MTMRGYHVERRAGWDTHGLPVEVEVEKQLRIRGKEAIVEYGVDRFAKRCLDSVFQYTEEWEHLTERIAFWVDLDKAYVTYHKSYVESVWWALSELFKKGLLYKGHKVVWWWAQGGTALSSGEVGNAYKTIDDPSAYVRLPLVGEEASLVVWTTTPWTLPSNMFAAVHADFDYAYAKDAASGEVLVVAAELVPRARREVRRRARDPAHRQGPGADRPALPAAVRHLREGRTARRRPLLPGARRRPRAGRAAAVVRDAGGRHRRGAPGRRLSATTTGGCGAPRGSAGPRSRCSARSGPTERWTTASRRWGSRAYGSRTPTRRW